MKPWQKTSNLLSLLIFLLFFLSTSIQIASSLPLVYFFQDLSGVYSQSSDRLLKQKITKTTLSYVKGENFPLPFTPKENFHLKEVRQVFSKGKKIWLFSCSVALPLLIYFSFFAQEKIRPLGRFLTILFLFFDLCLLFAFPYFFRLFHQILFSPGSWQFGKDSLLLQLFPYQFWVIQSFFVFSLAAFLSSLTFFFLRSFSNFQDRILRSK